MHLHPEQNGDEIYMGNTSAREMIRSDWRSKRTGFAAYDINGENINHLGLVPWFINTDEVWEKIVALSVRVAHKTGDVGRDISTIRIYRDMVKRRTVIEKSLKREPKVFIFVSTITIR